MARIDLKIPLVITLTVNEDEEMPLDSLNLGEKLKNISAGSRSISRWNIFSRLFSKVEIDPGASGMNETYSSPPEHIPAQAGEEKRAGIPVARSLPARPARRQDARYFISLGAGLHQLPLMRAARRMGLKIIAADRNHQAPGIEEADIRLIAPLHKPEKIHRLIRENLIEGSVVGVGTRSSGPANLCASYLAASFEVGGMEPGTLRFFRNKRRMKEILARMGVRVPRSYSWKSLSDRWELKRAEGPLVARPASGQGKKGVELLDGAFDIKRFLRRNPRDTGRILVEDFIEGYEIVVLGIVKNGAYQPVSITDKTVSRKPPLFMDVKHVYPSRVSPEVEEEVSRVMSAIVEASELVDGPLVAEFIVRDEEAYLVECAPEAGGEFIADTIVPRGVGVDFFEMIIASLVEPAEENEYEISPLGSPREAVVIRYLPPREGRLESLIFPRELMEHPGFLFAHALKEAGATTSLGRGNLDRIGVFALSGPLEKLPELELEAERFARETTIEYGNVKRSLGQSLPQG